MDRSFGVPFFHRVFGVSYALFHLVNNGCFCHPGTRPDVGRVIRGKEMVEAHDWLRGRVCLAPEKPKRVTDGRGAEPRRGWGGERVLKQREQ